MQTVVETRRYLSDAERVFTPEERDAVVNLIAANPRGGVVIPDSHEIRKIRVGMSGRGKRGGARVIFLFGGDDIPVFLLAAVDKSEKSDLSAVERRAMGKAVSEMLRNYRRR